MAASLVAMLRALFVVLVLSQLAACGEANEAARGPVVLASDAAHFYANIERESPFPIVFNVGEMARGWHAARKLAGDAARVIPGHDPEIRRRYPTAGDDEIFALHLPPR